ncbi:hypothetical protein GN958_ATG10303 [Phytophthora infestans]|uniref:Uncharacterized protein n=1 Tax=Phytophthora infestans TaxID=4787 RepID=A0A8S9ULY7_PHYIN|nr:hypothetical protein GN958_ATG10303 [Phytophthora infestans]
MFVRQEEQEFHINSSGNPVQWDGERDLLEQIATGKVIKDDQWSQDEKDEHTKKQAKIQMLIMGSLKTTLAQPLMDQKNGTDVWAELCKTYKGSNNDATKAQKVYRLQGEQTGLISAQMVTCVSKQGLGKVLEIIKASRSKAILPNQKGGSNKSTGDVPKKRTLKTDIERFNCSVKGHYKSNCPDQEVKFSPKKRAQAKMARTDEKSVEKGPSQKTGKVIDHAHKRDVVVGEVGRRVAKSYEPSRWYFDSGTNAHIVRSKEYFTVMNNMEDSDWNPTISGFADGVDARRKALGRSYLLA